MKYTWKLLIVSSIIALTACAPINTQFSCNETAGDRCLSIEEVNAMTEKVDKDVPLSGDKSACKTCKSNQQTIWLAPWRDAQGHLHENETLFAYLSTTKG
jgi:hypothetical protein